MKAETSVAQLLQWRQARAGATAPRAPRGIELLELARPWWEIWPDRFKASVESLQRMQMMYGHAMAVPNAGRGGHPVPALVVREGLESKTSVRVLYFSVQNGRLRLRFQLEAAHGQGAEVFEATFVDEPAGRPFFSADARLSMADEYRVDVELPPELARNWEPVKVTDRMPFRLILHPLSTGG
jgi:hypothetical protein